MTNNLQNITQKTKDWVTLIPLKTVGWTQVLRKGKQFGLHMWDPCICLVANSVISHVSWSHHFENFTIATMILLTATEYLCHKWPRICYVRRNHNFVLSPFMTYHRVCNKTNTRVSHVESELLTLPTNYVTYINLPVCCPFLSCQTL
jgi:hypothetical protein